ncbi:MAG: SDR family NAD(P)-dependent oxidoreductase [Acidimicrobiales bacterium]
MSGPSNGAPVSLVTGANKGIGLETVRRLIGAGHTVYLGARDVQRGRAAAEPLGARFVELDVTSDDSVSRAADLVLQEEGRLDVLVNNAGITGPFRDVHDYTGDDAAEVLMTNLVGYVRVMHAFLPLLERSSDPRIVNVSSGLGSFELLHDPSRKESSAGQPLYSASKAAVNMLSARYAKLLPGIRINIADPGLTDTDLSRVEGHPGAGLGHSVEDGADAIVAFATGGSDTPTGAYRDRDGDLPW